MKKYSTIAYATIPRRKNTLNYNELTYFHQVLHVRTIFSTKMQIVKISFALPSLVIVHHQINSSCWNMLRMSKVTSFWALDETERVRQSLLLSQWKWLFIPIASLHSSSLFRVELCERVWQEASSRCFLENLCDSSLFPFPHFLILNC